MYSLWAMYQRPHSRVDPIKLHYICVDCRKCRKSRGYADPKCPHCGKPMRNMGKNFHTPKRDDVKEWERIGLALRTGMTLSTRRYDYWRKPQRARLAKETLKAAKKRAETVRRERDVDNVSYEHMSLRRSLLERPPKK